jgi:hypothetical protein
VKEKQGGHYGNSKNTEMCGKYQRGKEVQEFGEREIKILRHA